MNITLKKHANIIVKENELILSLDNYLFKNNKNVLSSFCATKAFQNSNFNLLRDIFSYEIKSMYILYIDIVKNFIISNLEAYENNNRIHIKNISIKDLKNLLEKLEYPDYPIFKLILKYKLGKIIISINEKNQFNINHSKLKKYLSIRKYEKLLNIFKVSLLVNNFYKNKTNCNSFYKNKKSLFDYYFKYIYEIMEK